MQKIIHFVRGLRMYLSFEWHLSWREEYSSLGGRHSTLSLHHSTLGEEHSSLDLRHSTLQSEHSSLGSLHSTLEEKHSSLGLHHSTLSLLHSTLQDSYSSFLQHDMVPLELVSTAIIGRGPMLKVTFLFSKLLTLELNGSLPPPITPVLPIRSYFIFSPSIFCV